MSAAVSRLPRPVQLGGGLLLALALNVLLIQSMLLLNRAAAARAPEVAAAHRAELREPPPVREPEPVEEVREVEELEPLMQVDLDAAAPELDELVLPELSFDLDLSLAASTTSVRVRSDVAITPRREAETQPAAARSEGPLDSDSVDEPPRELASSREPTYPRAAQRRRIEGLVTIELLIDEEGRVRDYRRAEGDPLLVKAVTDVARDLRFRPARHQGQAVAVWGRKSFRFELPDR